MKIVIMTDYFFLILSNFFIRNLEIRLDTNAVILYVYKFEFIAKLGFYFKINPTKLIIEIQMGDLISTSEIIIISSIKEQKKINLYIVTVSKY